MSEPIFEATVPYEGSSLTVRARTRSWPNQPGMYREWVKGTQIYVHEKGETLVENFINRRNRPVDVYRDAAYAAIKLFPELDGHKLRWSVHAGCSMCPCSPGFMLKDSDLHSFRFCIDNKPVDLWVDIDRTTPYVPIAVQEEMAQKLMSGGVVTLPTKEAA